LNKWLYKLLERPGLDKGRNVPVKHSALEQNDKSEEELAKEAKYHSDWVQKGMKNDAKK
jgi:glutathione S-transferase